MWRTTPGSKQAQGDNVVPPLQLPCHFERHQTSEAMSKQDDVFLSKGEERITEGIGEFCKLCNGWFVLTRPPPRELDGMYLNAGRKQPCRHPWPKQGGAPTRVWEAEQVPLCLRVWVWTQYPGMLHECCRHGSRSVFYPWHLLSNQGGNLRQRHPVHLVLAEIHTKHSCHMQ